MQVGVNYDGLSSVAIGETRTMRFVLHRILPNLACDDDAQPAYIVQSLVSRDLIWKGTGFDFPDFAIPLADNLDNPKICPGLAGLDQALKDEILAAAAEEKIAQTENLKAQSQPAQAQTKAPRR